jgi:hypothetical protein
MCLVVVYRLVHMKVIHLRCNDGPTIIKSHSQPRIGVCNHISYSSYNSACMHMQKFKTAWTSLRLRSVVLLHLTFEQ